MPDLRQLDEEVDEPVGSDVPTIRGTAACTSEKKSVGEDCDNRGKTCNTQTQQCFIGG